MVALLFFGLWLVCCLAPPLGVIGRLCSDCCCCFFLTSSILFSKRETKTDQTVQMRGLI